MWRKRSKYGNRKGRFEGHLFDSQAEFDRYGELRLLEKSGAITGLTVHPTFSLTINEKYVGDAEFDFSYYIKAEGLMQEHDHVIEDVKGRDARTGRVVTDTELSRFKRRVYEALYGRTVTIVERTGKTARASRARSEKEWKKDAKDSR